MDLTRIQYYSWWILYYGNSQYHCRSTNAIPRLDTTAIVISRKSHFLYSWKLLNKVRCEYLPSENVVQIISSIAREARERENRVYRWRNSCLIPMTYWSVWTSNILLLSSGPLPRKSTLEIIRVTRLPTVSRYLRIFEEKRALLR